MKQNFFRITKSPRNEKRMRGFDAITVFRANGESRKSFKRRVAFISGNRKKVGGRGLFG